jgi:hypothetical protein
MAGTPALKEAVNQLLREKYGFTLDHYILTSRESGKSWEEITRHLNGVCELSLSFNTVRRWHVPERTSK